MIGNEQKTLKIRDFITCAFRACGLDAAIRSGVLFTRAGLAGVAGSRWQLVAALPLCADVPTATAALSDRADGRRWSASGRGFYVGVIRMSLDILLARGVIDRRALNILLSSKAGQARLQQWIERAQADEEAEVDEPDSVPRDTEKHSAAGGGINRLLIIKLLFFLVMAVLFLKS